MDVLTGKLVTNEELFEMSEEERERYTKVPEALGPAARDLLAWRDHEREQLRIASQAKREARHAAKLLKKKRIRRSRNKAARQTRRRNRGRR